jgi:hypothetical protein
MKIVGNPDCDAALVRSACRDPVALVSVHQHRGPSSRERVPTKRPCEPSLQWRLESLYSVMPSSNFRLLDSRTAAAAEDRFAGRHSGSLARYGKRRVGVSRSCGRWHDSVGRAHEIALRRTSCRGVDVDVRAPGRQRTWRTRLCVVRPAISSDSLSVRPALRPLCQKSRQISNRSVDQDAAPRRTGERAGRRRGCSRGVHFALPSAGTDQPHSFRTYRRFAERRRQSSMASERRSTRVTRHVVHR